MLEEFCNQLSDKAQLEIALRLTSQAMCLWEDHFTLYPETIQSINSLITKENQIQGGRNHIEIEFLEEVLTTLKNELEKFSEESLPIFKLKQQENLVTLWATCTQPLTNPGWKDSMPQLQKLVYTSIWNILAWICLRQKNNCNETHIYVAIKQAAEALTTGNLILPKEIQDLLTEYKNQTRSSEENSAWEKENQDCSLDHSNFDIHEIYEKIIGKTPVKDPPSHEAITKILQEMQDEGKSYWDQWEEYYHGTCIIYSYNPEKQSYWRTESDAITGDFYKESSMSREEMAKYLSTISLGDFRVSGFEV